MKLLPHQEQMIKNMESGFREGSMTVIGLTRHRTFNGLRGGMDRNMSLVPTTQVKATILNESSHPEQVKEDK